MKYIFWDIDGTLLKTGISWCRRFARLQSNAALARKFQFSHPLAE